MLKNDMRKMLCGLSVLIFCVFGFGASAGEREPVEIDLIIVDKAERKLHLMRFWEPVYSFDIDLGQSPVGHKQREGDMHTPEGFYHITYRNPDSDFFRSLHISYPDELDREFAMSKGYDTGGDIMIHGEPNSPIKRRNLKKDWTEGCIALRNEDMQVVWDTVKEGTPIIINP